MPAITALPSLSDSPTASSRSSLLSRCRTLSTLITLSSSPTIRSWISIGMLIPMVAAAAAASLSAADAANYPRSPRLCHAPAIYHMLRDGTGYQDLGADHFDHRSTEARARRLVSQLAKLGFDVEIKPLAAVA